MFHLLCFSGPAEVPVVDFGGGHFRSGCNEEAEKSRSARPSRRLVPLARSASAPMDFLNRDHSQILLEQAFNDGSFEMRFLLLGLHRFPQFRCFCFRPLFRRFCYHAHQRDRSPAGHSLSFNLCCGAGTSF